MQPEASPYPITDYWYEVTDEQIREHLARSLLDRLRWLDEARRFTALARSAAPQVFRAGKVQK
ncbi:MAG: hypothetical protein OEW90_04055 [Betaproteobacteria bacterium]|nr:hypothetical protein [Betaproteobacteria bacterium]MDH4323293.1 hypothetical protein [Betaproteobacteria bacterium]